MPWLRPKLARALRLSVDELDSLLTEADERHAMPQPTLPDRRTCSADEEDSRLLSLIGGLAADRPPLLESLSPDGPAPVATLHGTSLPQTIEVLLKWCLQLDDELGGDSLYLLLSRYVRRVAGSLSEEDKEGLAAFGALSQMVGWLALDANQHAAARRHLTTALFAAYEADEYALAASALAYMSLQETYRGDPRTALSLAQTAAASSSGRLTPLTKAMIATRIARAHAALGQRSGFRRQLDQARSSFELASQEEEPIWLSYFDDIELNAQEGACYLDAGMAAQASTALARAISLLNDQAPHRLRDHSHYLIRLAKCHLIDGEVERACEIAAGGLSLCDGLPSSRVVDPSLSGSRETPEHRIF